MRQIHRAPASEIRSSGKTARVHPKAGFGCRASAERPPRLALLMRRQANRRPSSRGSGWVSPRTPCARRLSALPRQWNDRKAPAAPAWLSSSAGSSMPAGDPHARQPFNPDCPLSTSGTEPRCRSNVETGPPATRSPIEESRHHRTPASAKAAASAHRSNGRRAPLRNSCGCLRHSRWRCTPVPSARQTLRMHEQLPKREKQRE